MCMHTHIHTHTHTHADKTDSHRHQGFEGRGRVCVCVCVFVCVWGRALQKSTKTCATAFQHIHTHFVLTYSCSVIHTASRLPLNTPKTQTHRGSLWLGWRHQMLVFMIYACVSSHLGSSTQYDTSHTRTHTNTHTHTQILRHLRKCTSLPMWHQCDCQCVCVCVCVCALSGAVAAVGAGPSTYWNAGLVNSSLFI